MENRNFLVLDGGLGSALIRAGFDIDVSNSTLFYFINAHRFIFSTTPGNTFIMHAAISHTISHKLVYMNRNETCMRSSGMGLRGNVTSQCLVRV